MEVDTFSTEEEDLSTTDTVQEVTLDYRSGNKGSLITNVHSTRLLKLSTAALKLKVAIITEMEGFLSSVCRSAHPASTEMVHGL